jgi:hypothetical protein
LKTTTAAKGSRSAKSPTSGRNPLSEDSKIAKGSIQDLENESNRYTLALHLEPEDNQRLTNLCGQFDQHYAKSKNILIQKSVIAAFSSISRDYLIRLRKP